MFDLPAIQIAATVRSGPGQWLSEVVATVALMGAILGGLRFSPHATPWLIGLTITAAYWFMASTSFANLAVKIARIFSDPFAGIAPASALLFVPAQLVGVLIGLRLSSSGVCRPTRSSRLCSARSQSIAVQLAPQARTSITIAHPA
jgi:glycerol uptake facilitator-like aquaporin